MWFLTRFLIVLTDCVTIKFGLLSFQNVFKIYFYEFFKYGFFIFITALKMWHK